MMPLIVLPLNSDFTAFHVFISLHDKEFSFSVHNVPPSNDSGKISLKNAKIQCDPEMRSLFQGFEEVLQDRLHHSTSIDTLCMEIKDILDRVLRAQPKSSLPPAQFYTQILYQINDIGWENLAFLGDDFTRLHLRIFDDGNREHILRMKLPPEYPDVEPSVSTEFPNAWGLKWSPHAGLKDALSHFRAAVESYQDFWNVMEDIDKRAWVIEPDHPSRADTFRRMALGGHCSLSITVDPLSSRSLPECRFFGSEMVVAPLRKRLNDNIRKWNLERYLLDNLEAVLELAFPRPQASAHEDLSADCGICYAYRMPDGNELTTMIPCSHIVGWCTCLNLPDVGKAGGSVPDRVCDNVSCGRPFHTMCLIEWLRSLTTTRISFNVLFGSCPYCSHPVAVKSTTC